MQEWPLPSNQRDVRAFLGFVQFFHRSIPDLARMSVPLIDLTKKDVAWSWSDKAEQAFQQIKDAVTSAPCLALIDYADEQNELFLYTDASLVGLSGILVV